MKDKLTANVSFTINLDQIEKLNEASAKLEVSKSEIIRHAIDLYFFFMTDKIDAVNKVANEYVSNPT